MLKVTRFPLELRPLLDKRGSFSAVEGNPPHVGTSFKWNVLVKEGSA
jgi:hypothetical protein